MERYTAPLPDAPRSLAPGLRGLDAVLLLTWFTVAGFSLGIATAVVWPTLFGVLMGAVILALTCAIGGVVTARVFRHDASPTELELLP